MIVLLTTTMAPPSPPPSPLFKFVAHFLSPPSSQEMTSTPFNRVTISSYAPQLVRCLELLLDRSNWRPFMQLHLKKKTSLSFAKLAKEKPSSRKLSLCCAVALAYTWYRLLRLEWIKHPSVFFILTTWRLIFWTRTREVTFMSCDVVLNFYWIQYLTGGVVKVSFYLLPPMHYCQSHHGHPCYPICHLQDWSTW